MDTVIEEKPQENQPLDSELLLLSSQVGEKKETNAFILSLEEPAVERKLQQLLDLNPKTWQELKDADIIPYRGSNKQFLVCLFSHYRNKKQMKADRIKSNGQMKSFSDAAEDSGMPKIVEAEKIQKIKLDRAREQEIHIRNSVSRNNLIDKRELFNLILPFIGNIANVLRSAADDDPKVAPVIDKCMQSLYLTGERLIEQAKTDQEAYVQHMMEIPVDFDAIIENAELVLE
jgi:hypothetical protein